MTAPHDIGLFGIKIRIKTPKFIKGALKVAGQGVSAVGGVAKTVGDTIGKVPVVGTPLHALYDLQAGQPFRIADSVVKGKRIDRIAYDELKTSVRNAQTIAPYAQAIVSMVPGVGTGAAGLIGAAYALSKGQSIDAAVVQGVRGAVPGGAVAQAAFDVGYAAVSGKKPVDIALAALPLPPAQKQVIKAGALALKDLADGKRVDETLVTRALEASPPDIKRGLQIGMAIAQGQNLQQVAEKAAPAIIGRVAAEGGKAIKANAIFKATPFTGTGFRAGIGVLGHKATPASIKAVRNALDANNRVGFDLALSARVGAAKTPPKKLPMTNPRAQFGYLAGVGARNATPKLRGELKRAVAKDPVAAVAFRKALKEESWWDKVLDFLGLDD